MGAIVSVNACVWRLPLAPSHHRGPPEHLLSLLFFSTVRTFLPNSQTLLNKLFNLSILLCSEGLGGMNYQVVGDESMMSFKRLSIFMDREKQVFIL